MILSSFTATDLKNKETKSHASNGRSRGRTFIRVKITRGASDYNIVVEVGPTSDRC